MFPLKVLLAIALLSTCVTCDSVAAEEVHWPGWLGKHRDGWVDGFRLRESWPESVKHRWQIEVGHGYGSPLVSDGRVYQHGRLGEDEVLSCVDLATGELLWRKHQTVPFKMGGGGEWHGKGPKSSPTISAGRVFTMSITGVLSAWNADDGELLWRREDYGQRFKTSHPYWGASTSPIVDQNRVVVHFGNDDEGVLVALDVATGEEIWAVGKDGPSYSSPLLVEIQGVRQVVEWNHRALVGVQSESGKLLWEFPFPHVGSNQNMPTPAVHDGRVLLGGENRGLHCLEPNREADSWSVRRRWKQTEVALDMSSAVVNGDLLYGFSHYGKGRLFCLDTTDGKILWQSPGRTGDNVAFLAVPGYVLALLDQGELRVIKATGEAYTPVASYRVAESPTWAPPVLLNGGLLIKDLESLTYWSFAP